MTRTPEEIREHGAELASLAGSAGQDNGAAEASAIALMGIISMLTEIAAQIAEMRIDRGAQ